TFLLLANPGTTSATATVRYLPDGGAPTSEQVTVAPGSRATINVGDRLPARDLGFEVSSSQPIIAERAVYAVYSAAISGGHAVVARVAERVPYHVYNGLDGAHGAMGLPDLESPPPPAEPPPAPARTPVVQRVVSGFSHIWSVAFAADGRYFFSERTTGRIYSV